MADGGVGAIDLSKVWDVNGPDALVTLTIRALLAQSFVVAGWILVGTYVHDDSEFQSSYTRMHCGSIEFCRSSFHPFQFVLNFATGLTDWSSGN